jgi:hypothetical protein
VEVKIRQAMSAVYRPCTHVRFGADRSLMLSSLTTRTEIRSEDVPGLSTVALYRMSEIRVITELR